MVTMSLNPRAAILNFRREVNLDARCLMIATMVLSSLMMGNGVTRALFVLRLALGTELFGSFNVFGALGYMGSAFPAGLLSSRTGLEKLHAAEGGGISDGVCGRPSGGRPAASFLGTVLVRYAVGVGRWIRLVLGECRPRHYGYYPTG